RSPHKQAGCSGRRCGSYRSSSSFGNGSLGRSSTDSVAKHAERRRRHRRNLAGFTLVCVAPRVSTSSERYEPKVRINFAAAAVSDRGRRLLPQIWEVALDPGRWTYDIAHAASETTDRRALLNARAVVGAWDAPNDVKTASGVQCSAQAPVRCIGEIPAKGAYRQARAMREFLLNTQYAPD